MARNPGKPLQPEGENGLTPIHGGIHCPATTDGVEVTSEIDQMAVAHFVETLAQVALAVAARRLAGETDGV